MKERPLTDRPDRIPCITPSCRRTASAEKYERSTEIICGKCWRRLVPPRLKNRHKRLNAAIRKLERRKNIEPSLINKAFDLHDKNWDAIRRAVGADGDSNPDAKPAGLDAFLEETGL